MSIHHKIELPGWIEYFLIPMLNLLMAFLLTGVVVYYAGENPLDVFISLVQGAFGTVEGTGYTLYYTTNFIFTGLAVAMAFHCGLFNIGGEGQTYVAGLGVLLVCLWLNDFSLWVVFPTAILTAAIFGGLWAFIPGWLQAKRGSHVVITTIMFNYLATALINYLLVDVLIAPNQQSPQSRAIASHLELPLMQNILGFFGFQTGYSPLNISFFLALFCCFIFWLLIWKMKFGYELRVMNQGEKVAKYAGIPPAGIIISAMVISGMFAGLMAINSIMGEHHRLIIEFTNGAGFVGIAVALMGRNHPIGIIVAALLFGALYQGGSEMAFDFPGLSRDMIIVIQGLIVLFCGALENIFKPSLAKLVLKSHVARVKTE